jgi:hypothetical protein
MDTTNAMKFVLSVVDPEYPNDIQIEESINKKDLFESAVTLAERNGLYYYFIHNLKELNMDLPFLDNDRWNEENKKISEFKETVAFLNKASEDSAIDYILIKIFNTVPHAPNDVDTFVQKKDRQNFIKVLENNGMECLHSSPAETKFKGRYMKTDIYTEIGYLGVDFMDETFLWKSKVKNELFGIEYPALSNEADFLLLVPHYLFGHRRITLLDFLHMKYRMECINVDACREYANEVGWGSVFDLMINHLNHLYEMIYKQNKFIHFPHVFDRGFTLKCISGIEELNMGLRNKAFLHLSFVIEEITYSLEGTPLYTMLESFTPTRNLINSLSAAIKNHRGDKKSSDKK